MATSQDNITRERNEPEKFFVFLTIEGTEYVKIKYEVRNPNITLKGLIDIIINEFERPLFDSGGNPIQYLLGLIIDDSDEPEILEFEDEDGCEQALVDYHIQPIDHIHLISVPIAGGSYVRETFGLTESKPTEKQSVWNKLFGKKEKIEEASASAYAPAEISRHKHFIVRVFIHRPEESSRIDMVVKDVDKTAVKKANKSLNIPIKDGDEITVQLSMSEGIHIDEPIQNAIWWGRYVECDFGCELIKENIHSILGKAIVAINNVPAGDLKFTIDVVAVDSYKVYASVEPRRYTKIFISYAHADYSQVRGIAEGCKINGSDYFFDRHTLKAGDIFKDKILHYIDNADLFVLYWPKNAAESEWVQIERKHALRLIREGKSSLSIYPLCLRPEAPLPLDMSDKYNFGTL